MHLTPCGVGVESQLIINHYSRRSPCVVKWIAVVQEEMDVAILSVWHWKRCTIFLGRPGKSWWRHQRETFSALLALCAGNSPVTGEFPAQRPVTRSFDIFFDLWLNKRLSKQSWGWLFETPSHPLWRYCNVTRHIVHRGRAKWRNKLAD